MSHQQWSEGRTFILYGIYTDLRHSISINIHASVLPIFMHVSHLLQYKIKITLSDQNMPNDAVRMHIILSCHSSFLTYLHHACYFRSCNIHPLFKLVSGFKHWHPRSCLWEAILVEICCCSIWYTRPF